MSGNNNKIYMFWEMCTGINVDIIVHAKLNLKYFEEV